MLVYPVLFLFKSVAELPLTSTAAHMVNQYSIYFKLRQKGLEYEPGAEMGVQDFSWKILSDL